MNNYEYQVRISKLSVKDGSGYIAMVPELPGCISDGETYEEVIQNIQGAIEDWIETAKYRGQTIPEPILYSDDDEFSGKLMIRIPKRLHKELADNADNQGVSLNQLILSYLSKQAGIEECKKDHKLDRDHLLVERAKVNAPQKELKNLSFTFVNLQNKGWDILPAVLAANQTKLINSEGEE